MLNKYGEVITNASLESYNTYGIKTSTKYLIKPDTIENLCQLINYLKENNMPYYVLGRGSNVILPDNNFEGVIINLENLKQITINGLKVEAEAGVILSNLVKVAMENSLKGFESLGSIPGTLGGALYGNASFYKDVTIYTYLESVTVLYKDKIVEIPKKDIKLGHRYSSFKDDNYIILKAKFNLELGNKEEMQKVLKETREKRLNTQPIEYKNAGSVFKNPEGLSAGKLIDDAGLKGLNVNDAEVSMKHANFIVNKGNATSKDIKNLIKLIQDKIYEKDKVKLELEQIIVEWN